MGSERVFSLLIGFLVLATVLSVLGTVSNTPEGNGNDATRTWCISGIFCQLGEINDTCHPLPEPEKSRLGLFGLVWRVYVSKARSCWMLRTYSSMCFFQKQIERVLPQNLTYRYTQKVIFERRCILQGSIFGIYLLNCVCRTCLSFVQGHFVLCWMSSFNLQCSLVFFGGFTKFLEKPAMLKKRRSSGSWAYHKWRIVLAVWWQDLLLVVLDIWFLGPCCQSCLGLR